MGRKMKSPDDLRRELEEVEEETNTLSKITTIHIDETIRGVQYKGDFTFEVPNLGDTIMIGQMKAKYLPDGAKADPAAALIVEQICYLGVCLNEPLPPWWKPLDFHEQDLVNKVYAEGLAYANRFLGRDKSAEGSAGEDGEQDSGGDASLDEGPVGEDVRPSNKRSATVIHDTEGTQ
jgi:hypothetical protein